MRTRLSCCRHSRMSWAHCLSRRRRKPTTTWMRHSPRFRVTSCGRASSTRAVVRAQAPKALCCRCASPQERKDAVHVPVYQNGGHALQRARTRVFARARAPMRVSMHNIIIMRYELHPISHEWHFLMHDLCGPSLATSGSSPVNQVGGGYHEKPRDDEARTDCCSMCAMW